MTRNGKQVYKFGSFVLDAGERRLSRDGEILPLKPKTFDLLLTLVQSGGRLITKDELLEKVWDGAAVEESNITVHVSALRKVLGRPSEADAVFIENVPRYGYRFNVPVQEIAENDLLAIRKPDQTEVIDNQSPSLNTPPAIQPPLPARHFHRKRIALFVCVVLLGPIVAVVSLNWRSPAAPKLSRSLFLQTRMTRLTTSGSQGCAAISRDGKYVAYVVRANGKQSLWLRVLANASDLQLLPPEDAVYQGIEISPDSQMIYYDKIRGTEDGIYQLPVLGGVEKKLVNGTSGPPVSFSPDGKSFAFVRWNESEGTDDVWIASADGSQSRRLASHKIDQGETCAPAWSPNGNLIVCPWGSGDGMGLFGIRVTDGQISPLLDRTWSEIKEAVWLTDNSGLIITATDQMSDNFQVWLVSYPGGESRRLTNDVTDYRFPSVTRDSSSLVVVRIDRQSNIWTSPVADGSGARQITFSNYDADNDQGLAWTPDGRIVYASWTNGKSAIWITERNGTNRRQLTDNASSNSMPTVTPDGKYIVFASDRGPGGRLHLWKMEVDGSNPTQLTNGPIEFFPRVSPDGKWIVYHGYTSGTTTLWKLPIAGGEPVFLLNNVLDTYSPVSPDGKSVACVYLDAHDGGGDWKIAIAPFAGGPPLKFFDVRPLPLSFAPLQWTNDGKTLAYLSRQNDVSNVWLLNVQTGISQQMTTFASESAWHFDWSRDGQLAISRGKTSQDVVLITDVQKKD